MTFRGIGFEKTGCCKGNRNRARRLWIAVTTLGLLMTAASHTVANADEQSPIRDMVDFGSGYRPMQFDAFFDCAERAVEVSGTRSRTAGVYPKPSVVLPIMRKSSTPRNLEYLDIEIWDSTVNSPGGFAEPTPEFAILCTPSGWPLEMASEISGPDQSFVAPRTSIEVVIDDELTERWGYYFPDIQPCTRSQVQQGKSRTCVSGLVFTAQPMINLDSSERFRYPKPCRPYLFDSTWTDVVKAPFARASIFDKIPNRTSSGGIVKEAGVLHLTWKNEEGELITDSKIEQPPCNSSERSAKFRTQCSKFIERAYSSSSAFSVIDMANGKAIAGVSAFPEKINGRQTWATDYLGQEAGKLYERVSGIAIESSERALLFHFGKSIQGRSVSTKAIARALADAASRGEFDQYKNELANIDQGAQFWEFSISKLTEFFAPALPILEPLDRFAQGVMKYGKWWQEKELRQSQVRVIARLYGCAWVHSEVGGYQFR